GGELASKLAVEVLESYPFGLEDPQEEMRAAFRLANQKILALAQEKELNGMGTTLTALLLREETCILGHVGDSRAYLIRERKIQQLTNDHSVVGELLRSGTLSPEEAMAHPQRHLLTRALGTAAEVEVDVTAFRAVLDDVLVLCTDGLTSLVEEEEIAQVIERSYHPQQAADELVRLANERGGTDNITVIVAYLLPPFLAKAHPLEDTVELDGLLSEVAEEELPPVVLC
ncbi:MAG: protein phosphatase 2C domain-containing protein, partial [Bacillota bacterium]|nr:protein phosphatase 2C domain-containing protein [Bacillota bacterium]